MTQTNSGATAVERASVLAGKTPMPLAPSVEADDYVKAKWDDGRTSYFDREKPSSVRLKVAE